MLGLTWAGRLGRCLRCDRSAARRPTSTHPSGSRWSSSLYDTRWYLHLDRSGRAYVYRDEGRYQEVESGWLLEVVLAGRWGRANIVQQNVLSEFKKVVWARAATRHRISRRRSRYVIERCGLRLVYLGDDQSGVALEVMAIEREDGALRVIHAMPLRDRYRIDHEEAKRWRR